MQRLMIEKVSEEGRTEVINPLSVIVQEFSIFSCSWVW